MYAAPPRVETRVIARLPESFHARGRVCDRYEARPFYLEAPAFARDGTFYFSDIPGGRIFALAPDGAISPFIEYDGHPNGIKIHRDGRLFVADYRLGILAIDPASRRIDTVLERVGNERLRGPNDLTFSRTGDLYFTDQGNSDVVRATGRVIRLRAEGGVDVLLEGIPSPNGIVLSPDETVLYVAATRSNAIWRVPLAVPPGLVPIAEVGTTGVFVQMSGGTGPDGLAVDECGNLLVAHTGMGCAWLFSPIGEPLLRVQSCTGLSVANVAYGGADRSVVYLVESSSGSILAADMPVAGHRLFSHLD